ncbi:hypothetical protein FKW77_003372 [Venturia effusa]|uniref:Uncharacterized protein n=1 Tax=Venturia effusa TaxID=50376 RepID=A0A517LH15_9PEZI|nr:hypothetical protein FKW77_003372 [Venturia effusa]
MFYVRLYQHKLASVTAGRIGTVSQKGVEAGNIVVAVGRRPLLYQMFPMWQHDQEDEYEHGTTRLAFSVMPFSRQSPFFVDIAKAPGRAARLPGCRWPSLFSCHDGRRRTQRWTLALPITLAAVNHFQPRTITSRWDKEAHQSRLAREVLVTAAQSARYDSISTVSRSWYAFVGSKRPFCPEAKLIDPLAGETHSYAHVKQKRHSSTIGNHRDPFKAHRQTQVGHEGPTAAQTSWIDIHTRWRLIRTPMGEQPQNKGGLIAKTNSARFYLPSRSAFHDSLPGHNGTENEEDHVWAYHNGTAPVGKRRMKSVTT